MWRKGPPKDDRWYWVTIPGWLTSPTPVVASHASRNIIQHWIPSITPPPAPPNGLWSKKMPAGTGWYWIYNSQMMWIMDVELENILNTKRKGSLWWPHRLESPKVIDG
jgi:hypothetical protein